MQMQMYSNVEADVEVELNFETKVGHRNVYNLGEGGRRILRKKQIQILMCILRCIWSCRLRQKHKQRHRQIWWQI